MCIPLLAALSLPTPARAECDSFSGLVELGGALAGAVSGVGFGLLGGALLSERPERYLYFRDIAAPAAVVGGAVAPVGFLVTSMIADCGPDSGAGVVALNAAVSGTTGLLTAVLAYYLRTPVARPVIKVGYLPLAGGGGGLALSFDL